MREGDVLLNSNISDMFDTNHDDQREDDIEPTDEGVETEPEIEEVEESTNDKLKQLRAKLAACDAEKRSHLEDLQRTKADFLNSKKRLEENSKQTIDRTVDTFLLDLLPLCDSFAMAMNNIEVWGATPEQWRKGMEGINQQLLGILNKYDVVILDPIGEVFDPTRHEAMSTKESPDTESDIIIEVLQRGYERKGTIIRPAKVIISA